MSRLATSFGNYSSSAQALNPLSDDQIRKAAPSIFAGAAHASRSPRYAYIPTSTVLDGLRK